MAKCRKHPTELSWEQVEQYGGMGGEMDGGWEMETSEAL